MTRKRKSTKYIRRACHYRDESFSAKCPARVVHKDPSIPPVLRPSSSSFIIIFLQLNLPHQKWHTQDRGRRQDVHPERPNHPPLQKNAAPSCPTLPPVHRPPHCLLLHLREWSSFSSCHQTGTNRNGVKSKQRAPPSSLRTRGHPTSCCKSTLPSVSSSSPRFLLAYSDLSLTSARKPPPGWSRPNNWRERYPIVLLV